MITAVLDTNVFVQALIGSPRSASVRSLRALDAGRFQLALSNSALDELGDVLALPSLRDKHGMSDDEILEFLLSFVHDALMMADRPLPAASLTRDLTDTKFLALAAACGADYLVTNDRRHLLPIGEYEGTKIVTPAAFLRELP